MLKKLYLKLRSLQINLKINKLIADLNNLYEKKWNQEKEFAQNVFSKPTNLYKEKKVNINDNPENDILIDKDEVEYLSTIGFFHWMIYPYLKALRNILHCRRKPIPFKEEFKLPSEKEKED